MHDGRATRLLLLLEQEHAAILTGNFAALGKLASDREALLLAVTGAGLPAADLRMIRAKASVNAQLLKSAIAGVSTARQRLSALARAQDGLEVYDASGKVARVAVKGGGVERKA